MRSELIESIEHKLLFGTTYIMSDYTDIALMINACGIATERYKNSKKKIHLSTTANIPKELRLKIEIEDSLKNEELVDRYENKVLKQIIGLYVTNSVAITDSIFEDIYEILLKEYEPDLSQNKIDNKLRSSWANNNLIDYYLDKTNLQDSSKEHLKLKEAFDRYLEYRIIRHSLVHNKGVLSEKHIRQLDELYENSDEDDKKYSMKNSPFYENKKVELDITIMLKIRKYLFNNLTYFLTALEEKK